MGTGFRAAIRACSAIVRKLRGAGSAEARVDHPRRSQVKSARLITARVRWCAIPTAASIGARGLFVLTLGYSRKSVRLLVVPFQCADLGRAA